MDSVFIRRKNRIKVCVIALALVTMLLSVSGCDVMVGRYPPELSNTWICEEPRIEINYVWGDNYALISKETIRVGDKDIEVDIGFGSYDFDVLPKNSGKYDDRLIRGSWEYQNGDLVLHIEEDFLFDNQYTKLIFKAVDDGTYTEDVIPDKETAITIATAIFNSMEKSEAVVEYILQEVRYDSRGKIWLVSFEADAEGNILGGAYNIALQGNDGKVLRIWFSENKTN